MTNLVLQILGNSDILSSDSHEGYTILEEFGNLGSKDEILKKVKKLPLDEIDFPLIKKLIDSKHGKFDLKNDTIFCFILSDQSIWINENEPYKEFIYLAKKDGIYWKDSLKSWFKAHYQNLDCFTIPIVVDSTIKNGVADWESMTKLIQKCLNDPIDFSGEQIKFKPPCENDSSNQPGLTINKIIIQHSSGTPALSGALYLWGIEHKIEGRDVEFVYISDQDEDEDSCEFHSGSHWQWRLKVPQIQELLKIQDFSGAIQLVKTHQEYQQLEDILNLLKELDHAVSFNLSDRPFSEPKDAVIERIAIALWSETAFRERGQWMHWYLRIAGAFELAILCLLEKQGNGNYKWQGRNLFYEYNEQLYEVTIPITIIVRDLLGKGKKKISFKKEDTEEYTEVNYVAKKMEKNDEKWSNFKFFYLTEWDFGETGTIEVKAFTHLRNELYHSLMGDAIDNILDKKTLEINVVTSSEHPSEVAVKHLQYVIKLADLENKIDNLINNYKQKFLQLEALLT
jgi:hypothetical protein